MVDKEKREKQIREMAERLSEMAEFQMTGKEAIKNFVEYVGELEDCHHLTEKQALKLIEKTMIIGAIIFDDAYQIGLNNQGDDNGTETDTFDE